MDWWLDAGVTASDFAEWWRRGSDFNDDALIARVADVVWRNGGSVGEAHQLPFESCEATEFGVESSSLLVVEAGDAGTNTSDGGEVAGCGDDAIGGFLVEVIILFVVFIDDGDGDIGAVAVGSRTVTRERTDTDDETEEVGVADDVLLVISGPTWNSGGTVGSAKLIADGVGVASDVFGPPEEVGDTLGVEVGTEQMDSSHSLANKLFSDGVPPTTTL